METIGMSPNLKIPQAVKKGYIECPPRGVFDWAYPTSKFRRARVQDGGQICPAITCSPELYYYEGVKDE